MTAPEILQVILNDKWNNDSMFFWGTVYVSVDFLGLLVVPGLSRDTKIHHTVVCILGTLSAISDYRVRGLHQALLALTYLSAVPYIVNTYLGLRHLNNKRLQEGLISACFYVYALSILLNFWIQHMYVFYLIPGGLTVAKLCYLLAYYLILKDDIHLMGYFRYKVKDPSLTSKNQTVAAVAAVAAVATEKKPEVKTVEINVVESEETKIDHKNPDKIEVYLSKEHAKATVIECINERGSKCTSEEAANVYDKNGEKSEKSENCEKSENSEDVLSMTSATSALSDEQEELGEEDGDAEVLEVPEAIKEEVTKAERMERLQVEPVRTPAKKSRFNLDFFMQLISKGKIE